MKILSRTVLALVVLLGALIAVSNREPVELGLWPFSDYVKMPLYLAIVLLLLLGVLIGLTMGWVAGRGHRKLARERRREADRLGREVTDLRTRLAAHDKRIAAAAAPKEPPPAEIRSLERQRALVDPDGAEPVRTRG
ncbi:MAG TPA: lipopolysaccharide assembly protein LapA domain-containing protein [Vineibacter sp.]|nr:lipopolysaccharide assembly protein LapA domain-containing protein [Vineibacter sp.]